MAVTAFGAGKELAGSDSAQRLDGKKRAGIAKMHATHVVAGEASRRDAAVDMRMSEQALAL
jgi:hypothetical protein